MPSASSRANSSAQPGSSTITASPARSSVRLTISSACVAPTVVTTCSGPAGTLMLRELGRQAAAQAAVARRLAVLQREVLQRPGAGHAAHRSGREGRVQPLGREHAHAGLRLVARAMEHAADEGAGIGGHGLGGAGVRRPDRWSTRPARPVPRSSRAHRSRAGAGPRPAPARAAGHRRRPRCAGSRPAAARIRAPRAAARRAPAVACGCAPKNGRRAVPSATGWRSVSACASWFCVDRWTDTGLTLVRQSVLVL